MTTIFDPAGQDIVMNQKLNRRLKVYRLPMANGSRAQRQIVDHELRPVAVLENQAEF
jgi:hypothetical protein